MKRPRIRLHLLAGLLACGLPFLQGCSGNAGNAPFVTAIQLSPATSILAPGESVQLTATVSDSTKLKEARWTASGGQLSTDRGTTVQWTAPFDAVSTQTYTLTLTVTQTNGLRDTVNVKLTVVAGGALPSTTGARITSITTSSPTVALGGTVSLSVTLADPDAVNRVSWEATVGNLVQSVGTAVTWIAPSNAAQNSLATIRATALGFQGEVSVADVTLLVNPSAGPSLPGRTGLIKDVRISGPGAVSPGDTVPITATVDDPSQLANIRWTADGGTLTSDMGEQTSWVAPEITGVQRVFVIQATATNLLGEQNSARVQVVVRPRS